MNKLVYDLNEKFVPGLRVSIMDNIAQLREEFLDMSEALSSGLSHLNELIHNNQKDGFIDNGQNYRTCTEELDHLRGEVEELRAAIISNSDIHGWEAPTHSDILNSI